MQTQDGKRTSLEVIRFFPLERLTMISGILRRTGIKKLLPLYAVMMRGKGKTDRLMMSV